jgi:hypothetical protein
MDTAQRAILDSLPPPRRGSKLDPYAALIRALRARGRSYREIVTILRERCGVRVATHTLYHFVNPGSPQRVRSRSHRRSAAPVRDATVTVSGTPPPSSGEDPSQGWMRIEAVKRRAPTAGDEPKVFTFDEDEPLRLITPPTPTKRR